MQDMASWSRDGIAGLQSVVLYSLPELDGAIDTVPLGGLVGDNIFLVSERVTRLSQRIKKWVHLRRSQPQVSPINPKPQTLKSHLLYCCAFMSFHYIRYAQQIPCELTLKHCCAFLK